MEGGVVPGAQSGPVPVADAEAAVQDAKAALEASEKVLEDAKAAEQPEPPAGEPPAGEAPEPSSAEVESAINQLRGMGLGLVASYLAKQFNVAE